MKFNITRRSILKIVLTAVAWALAILWTTPFIGLFMVAIRPMEEIMHGWWNVGHFSFTYRNFITVWTGAEGSYPLHIGIRNSLIIAVFSSIIPLAISALAAYVFARFDFPVKNLIFLSIVLLMGIPQQIIAVPLFRIMKDLRLLNTYLGLILAHSAWGAPWIILFLRNYFLTLPKELEEAARVDGASDFQIFLKIVMPLSKPALLSILALQFTWVWNDFFFALLLMMTPDKYVATQCLAFLKGKYHVPWGLLGAGSIITMSLPILLYFALQKYYIRGMIGWVIRG